MTVIRHTAPSPTDIPPIDITTDFCPCGASYQTRNGDPDRVLYDAWCDVHLEHMEP